VVASGTEREAQGGKKVVIVDGIVVVDEKLSQR